MAPHSSTLAWKIPWTEEPGRLRSMGSPTEWLPFHFSLSCTGEGNGNPLQCSCLENPRDGGAWWAAVYGVAQSQTRLKWLSSSSRYILLLTIEMLWFIINTYLVIWMSKYVFLIYILFQPIVPVSLLPKPSEFPSDESSGSIFCYNHWSLVSFWKHFRAIKMKWVSCY